MSDIDIYNSIKDYILRITAALYRVTDILHDAEPLKWSLRRDAMDIVEFLSGKFRVISDIDTRNIEKISERIESIEQKLVLAEAGGFVSRINFEVLGREYRAALEKLRRVCLAFPGSTTRGLTDLVPGLSLPPRAREDSTDHQLESRVAFSDRMKKQTSLLQSQKTPDAGSVGAFSVPRDQAMATRKKLILEHMTQGKWVSAGDLRSLRGSQFSEKTIQRDLHALVKEEVLQAVGNKRWRRYTLKAHTQKTEAEAM